jgi:RNA polymerase sigma factor (sigma-70 family)
MAYQTPGVDRDALIELVRVRIRGFATYLQCGDDAEDIAHDTVLVVLSKYAGVEAPEEILKIANRICVNLVLNLRRKRAHEELDSGIAAPVGADPETVASNRELRQFMLGAIEASDSRCKQLLRMKLEGASTEEIAKELKLNPNAVHAAFFRCGKRLRAALGGSR